MKIPDNERVSEGDIVLINFYDDIHNTEGIVRKVIDRQQGILSVRIPTFRLPREVCVKYVLEGGMLPLVIGPEHWKFVRRLGI